MKTYILEIDLDTSSEEIAEQRAEIIDHEIERLNIRLSSSEYKVRVKTSEIRQKSKKE